MWVLYYKNNDIKSTYNGKKTPKIDTVVILALVPRIFRRSQAHLKTELAKSVDVWFSSASNTSNLENTKSESSTTR